MQSIKTLSVAIAAVLLASVAQAQMPAAIPTSCVIHTPQKGMTQGKKYEVTFEGCSGNAPIFLRYGDPSNLEMVEEPACASTDLSKGACYFTPKKSYEGKYSFSTTDASGVETFSGRFDIEPKKQASSAKAKHHTSSQKVSTASAQKKPQAQAMRRKRSLYDIHSFGML